MVTIKDVAEKAGVCMSTVSRVINQTAPVNEDTRRRILNVMGEMRFSPSLIAQGMRSQKTKTIAMVIPDYANPFYSHMYKAIEISLRQHDYMSLICPTSGKYDEEITYIDRLIHRRIDGIIFFTYNNGKEHVDLFRQIANQIPFVLMDESIDDLPVSQVITNGYKGMKNATKYLIEKGHTRIGCITSLKSSCQKRALGYIDALIEKNIQMNPDLLYSSGYDLKDGVLAAEYFVSLANKPTAVVAITDLIAIGLITGLTSLGINVPEEIEVIGFDDIDLATIITPKLTTVAQQIDVLATEAVAMIMDKINNPKKIPEIKKVIIQGNLIFRQSTKI